ncbi:MAG: ATP-binding cassette domain-containing protein [Lactobacillales bacterium]|nr:ATP-binding cassette domain-containing protein [Lactobacillales bacterium]
MLNIQNINVTRGKNKILANFSLKLLDKEFIYITGQSGVGKSTLLKVINGEIKIHKGQITMDNSPLNTDHLPSLIKYRRKIGYIYQDFRLINDWTVFENIAYPLLSQGENLSIIKEKVINLAKQLKIADRLHHFPYEISGGEQQRVAIARAVIKSSRIILADEPTGNLDPQNTYEIAKFLYSIKEKYQTSILFVTHDMELVKKVPQKIVNLGAINND